MNGPQHFRHAERYARLSDLAFRKAADASEPESGHHLDSALWFQNQGRLHAELALAGATAAAFGIAWEAEQREEAGQWSRALDRTPEPLVTCGAQLHDDSIKYNEYCQLAIGHDGPHEHTGPGGLICWSDDQPESEPDPGPVPCVCGHPETHHAGRLEDTAPRGVCLSGCGCLQHDPGSSPGSAAARQLTNQRGDS